MEIEKIKTPTWFTVVAIVLTLWDLLGIASFFMGPTLSEEVRQTLTQEEQDLYASFPVWTTIAYAIAVFGGTLGSTLLIAKKKFAKPVFLIALVAVLIQMFHSIFIAHSLDIYGPGGLVMPVLVILVAFFQIWLANFGIRRGWLN